VGYALLPMPLSAACNLVLIGLGIHGSCAKSDVTKYHAFKRDTAKGVVLFTHSTFFDHMVIMKELNDTPRFVMSAKYICNGIIRWIARKCNVLEIGGSGNAFVVSAAIDSRKRDDPLLAVSPTAGQSHATDQEVLMEFKTGAFIVLPEVLPIVIRYTPYEPWLASMQLHDMIKRRLRGDVVHYTMRVLDPIRPLQDETPRQFADRCRELMQDEMRTTRICEQAYCGNPLLFLTSFLFLLCSYITWDRGMYAQGMIIVFVTSVMNHGTGNNILRLIDQCSNMLLGSLFCYQLMLAGQVVPVMFATFALCSYMYKLNHALYVHLPVCLGFLSIRRTC
jgi:hypothetical protein